MSRRSPCPRSNFFRHSFGNISGLIHLFNPVRLPDDDEAATKLDLAYAYQKMGDVDGAKEILEEVLKEGNDAQVSEAKNLIAALQA